jgi:hypothetical protein
MTVRRPARQRIGLPFGARSAGYALWDGAPHQEDNMTPISSSTNTSGDDEHCAEDGDEHNHGGRTG